MHSIWLGNIDRDTDADIKTLRDKVKSQMKFQRFLNDQESPSPLVDHSGDDAAWYWNK